MGESTDLEETVTERIQVPPGEGDSLETPPWLFRQLNEAFNFGWDAASSKENNLVGGYGNCLELNWCDRAWGVVYLNPPYSNPSPFLANAVYYMTKRVTTVALIKGDPSTRWWNDYVEPYAQLKWIRKRLRFYYKGQPTEHAANFPSVLAFYWGFPRFEFV